MGSFYEKAVEELFLNIMKAIIGLLCLGVIATFLVATDDWGSLCSNLSFIFAAAFSIVIFKFGEKVYAYHFFAAFTAALFLIDILFLDVKSWSLFMVFPAMTIYTFIFFRELRTQIAYLLIGIVSQFVAVYYLYGGLTSGFTAQIASECIYYLSYNLGIFAFCYFYVTNLKKFRIGLNASRLNLEKSKQQLKLKSAELGERNFQLKNYINSSKKQSEFETLVIEKLTPLGSNIDNFLGMLAPQIKGKLDLKERELLDFVTNNSDHLNQSISGLYEFGFVSKKTLKPEMSQVSQLVQEIKMEKFQKIVDENAYLGCDSCGVKVIGDKSQIKQLLNLLIDNAFHFTPEGIQPQIFIEAKEDEHNTYLKVMDNGLGIPEEHREIVFEIFTQMDSKNPNAGVGVGLSICKKIVEIHKGAIWVEESRFGGTCVSIQIPKIELREETNVKLENLPILEMSEN